MSDLQSKTISAIRFPLILGVIFIHSLPGLGVPNFLGILLSKEFTQIAVPTFFFISGFLFFYGTDGFDSDAYKAKINKRWKTLMLPFLLWTVIAVIPFVVMHICKVLQGQESVNILVDYCRDVNTWINGPFNYHLWFLRELIVVSIASPIIYFGLRLLKKWWLGCLVFVYLLDSRANTSMCSSQSFLFFSWGAYYCIIGAKEFCCCFYETKTPLLFIASFMIVLSTLASLNEFDNAIFLHKLMIVVGVPAAIILRFMLCKNTPENGGILSQSSYFVYLAHVFIIPITGILTNKLYALDIVHVSVLTYMLRPLLIAFICVGIYYSLSKRHLKCWEILMGNH